MAKKVKIKNWHRDAFREGNKSVIPADVLNLLEAAHNNREAKAAADAIPVKKEQKEPKK